MDKSLLDRILDFCAHKKRRGDGGDWPDVIQFEVDALTKIVRDLIDARFERDMDNSPVIEFTLVNRRKYDRLYFKPMPYEYHLETEDELLDLLNIAELNLSIAAGQVDLVVRLLQDKKRERLKQGIGKTNCRSPKGGK